MKAEHVLRWQMKPVAERIETCERIAAEYPTEHKELIKIQQQIDKLREDA